MLNKINHLKTTQKSLSNKIEACLDIAKVILTQSSSPQFYASKTTAEIIGFYEDDLRPEMMKMMALDQISLMLTWMKIKSLLSP